MSKKYESRFATTEDDEKQYFYYADTLEELPVHICIALAVNGDESYSMDGLGLTPEAETVMSRAASYVQSSGAGVTVYANHEISEPEEYVNHLAMDDDGLVTLSLKHFCPEMSATWKRIRPEVREVIQARAEEDRARAKELAEDKYNAANPMVRFTDGRYEVGFKPGMIRPGRYRLKGPVVDCYWERSARNGATISNNFVTNAPGGITVSVRAGEGFTSENCAEDGARAWERVA